MNFKNLLDSKRAIYTFAGVAAFVLLVVLLWPMPRAADPFADRARFSAAVMDVIRSNPEIVMEAVQTLQQRQGQAEQAQSKETVAAARDQLEKDVNSPVGGNPNGDVTLVEFYDYRCPYCRQAQSVVRDLIKSDANLRFVYKEFPILGPDSVVAARAAVGARNSVYYEAFHDALITAPNPLDLDHVLKIAAGVGLNVDALQLEMRKPEVDQILAANHALAEQIGINGTPAFIVGDNLVPGVVSLQDLQMMVAAQRARNKG
ncbi:MAG TPA: DsbA family protein [Alphaproteobacteria bacterium]